jgi:hypothetical protein
LVTHYRHEHIVSHDRAWQNKRYAKPIPGYDYDTKKLDVNNRAKRQLIRAIRRHMLNGTYSAEAPVPGLALIEAFGRLKDGDDETIECIRSTLEKLAAGPTH